MQLRFFHHPIWRAIKLLFKLFSQRRLYATLRLFHLIASMEVLTCINRSINFSLSS